MNLVTGATGIVGSHVVLELLLRNQPVVACRQRSSSLAEVEALFASYAPEYTQLFEKIKWVEADLLDPFSIEEALKDIDTVYHCAGMVSFNKKDNKKLMAVNETGTANVVNACLNKKNVVLCHVSSIGTINNSDYTQPLHEEVFWKTSGRESQYAISKYNGEREVWRGIEEGLKAVIVNPGVVLSPGFRNRSSARIFDKGARGNKFYTSGTTGYVAAADLAKVMVELVQLRKFGNRYIVIENNYSYKHIFSQVQSGFKQPPPTVNVRRGMLRLLQGVDAFVSFILGREQKITSSLVNAAFNRQLFSNKKIKEALNFNFIPADEAIRQICRQDLSGKKQTPTSA